MEYLLKASVVICIFYLFYRIFLQRETFFQANRIYLLIGLMASVFFPLIVIPIYIEITPSVADTTIPFIVNNESQHAVYDNSFDWIQFLYIIYSAGLAIFLGKLLIELTSLKLLFSKHSYYKDKPYLLIETENNIPPFSFFNWIVYNPKTFTDEELKHILNHEKAHAKEFHSIDIILTQLACILLWFNPLIWLYKKEIQQNLEFIADKEAQNISNCERSYQHVLLKSSVKNHKILITNNFYNSQIKKRIIMLHKSKSKKLNALKYALMLPAMAIFLMSFNTKEILIEIDDPLNLDNTNLVEAVSEPNDFNAKEEALIDPNNDTKKSNTYVNNGSPKTTTSNNVAKNNTSLVGDISITIITKNTTDAELDKIKEKLEKEGLTIKFKGIKRNSEGEIMAIKIDAKSKKSSTNYQISADDKPIEPIKIIYDEENNSISIGNGHAKHGKNTFVYETHDGGKYKIHKSGEGSNVFVFSDEEHGHEEDVEHEHDAKVIVRGSGKKGKLKKIKRSKDVHVISGDEDGEVIEIIVDDEDEDKKKEVVIVNGNRVSTTKDKGKNVWVTKVDDKDNTFVIELDDNDSNIFISDDNGKSPLFIIDGKESTKEEVHKISPKLIESVTVLKDKSATEKYGEKGKNGVIVIKTKED
ncbi:M56 family metallopeptidase [Winogradskyella sp.]|uniref:M56 family metallopeptidase n=2 Tax=Winogradskyella sp. TaxID=1883156 RepID=UPI00351620F2